MRAQLFSVLQTSLGVCCPVSLVRLAASVQSSTRSVSEDVASVETDSSPGQPSVVRYLPHRTLTASAIWKFIMKSGWIVVKIVTTIWLKSPVSSPSTVWPIGESPNWFWLAQTELGEFTLCSPDPQLDLRCHIFETS